MITFEEALAKAKELKPEIDNYAEYEKSFVFGCKADNDYDGVKGPCVILKENGEAVNMVFALTHGYLGEVIRSGAL